MNSIIMKASWLARRLFCKDLTTPINGTRSVRLFGLRSHQSSRTQPKGRSEPSMSISSSLMLGRTMMKATGRSEEHTSELQSLMRISYAVFCLKKKNAKAIAHIHVLLDTTANIQYTPKHPTDPQQST